MDYDYPRAFLDDIILRKEQQSCFRWFHGKHQDEGRNVGSLGESVPLCLWDN